QQPRSDEGRAGREPLPPLREGPVARGRDRTGAGGVGPARRADPRRAGAGGGRGGGPGAVGGRRRDPVVRGPDLAGERADHRPAGRPARLPVIHQPPNVCTRRKTFRAMMIAAAVPAAMVVMRRLTSAAITPRLDVKRISGTSANGMPKESTTCEMTSVREGS